MNTGTTGSNGWGRSAGLTASSVRTAEPRESRPNTAHTFREQGRSFHTHNYDRELERALAHAQKASQFFDRALLNRAKELLETIDPRDQLTATVNLADVSATVASLWETAGQVTSIHRMILAALDTGILSALAADFISREQLDVFREALGDLSMDTVSDTQAEAIRSRLIDSGKKPLFIVSDVRDDIADDERD